MSRIHRHFYVGNWSELRLVVTGHSADLAPFRRAAGALRGRIDVSRSSIFTDDMDEGESQDLETDGLRRLSGDLRQTSYLFEGKYTDHMSHFRTVSKRYPRLAFVLVAFDNDNGENGSYLLLNGRKRWWSVPERECTRRLVERLVWWNVIPAGTTVDPETLSFDDGDDAYYAWCEAEWDCRDVAAEHWNGEVLKWLAALPAADSDPKA